MSKEVFFISIGKGLTLPSICITLQSNDPSLTTRLLPRSWNGGPFFFVPSTLQKHRLTRHISKRRIETERSLKQLKLFYNTHYESFEINMIIVLIHIIYIHRCIYYIKKRLILASKRHGITKCVSSVSHSL